MKAQWLGIYDRGKLDSERVHFRATTDIDLNYYIILDTEHQFLSNKINIHNRSCYWFSKFSVKSGENVVVYTRSGIYSTENRPDGQVFHFFFRGLQKPIYATNDRAAVLLELVNWITTT